MNTEMKTILEEVKQAHREIFKKMVILGKICDHQDEAGHRAQELNCYTGKYICRYCGKEL